MPPPVILSNIPYTMSDWRMRNWSSRGSKSKKSRGLLFLCSYSPYTDGHLLVGLNGQLWRLNTESNCDCLECTTATYQHWNRFCQDKGLALNIEWRPYRVDKTSKLDMFLPCCDILKNHTTTSITSSYDVLHHGKLENLAHLLIRLQRWIRRVVLHRPRALALAMALHPRLGAGSKLAVLGQDIMLSLVVTA